MKKNTVTLGIAAHPEKAIAKHKSETGKGAVGIMPVYCPEEIVHATGYLPIGMWGAQKKTISKARTYLPPFACSIMQSAISNSILSRPLLLTKENLNSCTIAMPNIKAIAAPLTI